MASLEEFMVSSGSLCAPNGATDQSTSQNTEIDDWATTTLISMESIATTSRPKRSHCADPTSPSPRRQKMPREATPIDGSGSLAASLNASTAAYTTIPTAGPSSFSQDETLGMGNQVDPTSEGGEARSVLFSDRDGRLDGDMTSTEPFLPMKTVLLTDVLPRREDIVDIEEEDEGEDDGDDEEEDLENDVAADAMEESHEAGDESDDIPFDPPVDLHTVLQRQTAAAARVQASQILLAPGQASASSSRATDDYMSRVIEGRHSHELYEATQVDQGEYQDDELDEDDDASYHSDDTEDFEMDHRPVLERTAVKKDIKEFVMASRLLRSGNYRVVDRLGEGTFSSVYLADDEDHSHHNNEYWCGEAPRDITNPLVGSLQGVKVALKKILATSSPLRIANELSILESLRGCRNVSQLISAWREEDQVIIVLPYHQTDDFRHFYRNMDVDHIRLYMKNLFQSLKDIHRRGIVHRDVKPANFLFDYQAGTGVLCDFGLAERYIPPRKPTCHHAPGSLESLHGFKDKTKDYPATEQGYYEAHKRGRAGEGRVGFSNDDKRPSVKTNRAGTRGFRAPEVLLKCPDQTVALDIWSAGIMLMSILSHKFPVFNSADDVEALMEIAAVFGRDALVRCALNHNRTIICNVPTIDSAPHSLQEVITKLNPHVYTPTTPNPTPEQSKAHIAGIDSAIDLCTRLLKLDATRRLTAAEALRHDFLRPCGDSEDLEQEELLEPTEGKCGSLHSVENGKHKANFSDNCIDMQFGMGIPPSRNSLCPEHEHFQQRHSMNPLAVTVPYEQEVDEEEEEAPAEDTRVPPQQLRSIQEAVLQYAHTTTLTERNQNLDDRQRGSKLGEVDGLGGKYAVDNLRRFVVADGS